MTIFATYNIKGGVGKTAAAVNLAWLSAHEGARTLVWDLDPQGAATFYFRIRAKVKGGGRGLVRGKHELEDLIKGTDFDNLDLLPADFSYRNLDLMLDEGRKPTRLRKLLKPLEEHYDHIFLDCAPSISLVSENVFRAAHTLLVPLIPTPLSLRTLEQLIDFVEEAEVGDLRILPFLSMVDRRKRLHRELQETLPLQHPNLLHAAIPYASEVERMGLQRAPVCSFAAHSAGALAYAELWQEIRAQLG